MHLYIITSLVTTLASLALGMYVYLQGRNKASNITLFLYALSVAIWTGGAFFVDLSSTVSLGIFWVRISVAGAIFIPVFFIQFVWALLEKIEHKKPILIFLYFVTFLFSIANLTPLYITGVVPRADFGFSRILGPVYLFYVIFLFTMFIYGFLELLFAFKNSSGTRRSQLFYVLLASIIGFISGASTLLPIFNFKVYPFGYYFVPFYVFIAAYAILKYRLFRLSDISDKFNSLETIVAAMAHEIRNPLASIKGLTQVLPENMQDPDFIKKFSEIVPRQLDRINNIVENLMRIGKPLSLLVREADLNKIIRDVIDLVRKRAEEGKVEIVVKLSDPAVIKADSDKLHQAFLNLILNALEAMTSTSSVESPNGGELKVESKKTKIGEKEVFCVEINDTGVGIPGENLRNIFDPFFTTKDKGAGLGLSVVYRIIKDHQGDIQVESEVGKGTTFRICLPIK